MTGNDDIDRTEHSRHMQRALDLAVGGRGRTSPNPLTGCVVVKDGRVIGEGFHRRHGAAHAEAAALEACSEDPRGAHLYCNLEPCARVYPGKLTPPCAGTHHPGGNQPGLHCHPRSRTGRSAVPASSSSAPPASRSRSASRPRRHCGLNLPFFTAVHYRRPFVHLKAAQSLDGRIATASGNSQWITDQAARAVVHELRAEHDAILVGRVTALRDNPRLTVRPSTEAAAAAAGNAAAPVPWRVVLDERLELPPSAHLVSDHHAARTLILTADRAGGCAGPRRLRRPRRAGGRRLPPRSRPRRGCGTVRRPARRAGHRQPEQRRGSAALTRAAPTAPLTTGAGARARRATGLRLQQAPARWPGGAMADGAATGGATVGGAATGGAATGHAGTGDQPAVSGAAADQLQRQFQRRRAALEAHGAQVIPVAAGAAGRLDLTAVLAVLYERGIRSLLVEGGSEVHTSLLKAAAVRSAHAVRGAAADRERRGVRGRSRDRAGGRRDPAAGGDHPHNQRSGGDQRLPRPGSDPAHRQPRSGAGDPGGGGGCGARRVKDRDVFGNR